MNKKIITLTSLLAVSFSMTFSMNTHAEIYKWKDASGQVHYSATPPTHKKAKAENIEDKILMSAGKYNPSSKSTKNTSSEEETEKTNDDDSSENKNAKNKPTKQLIDYCKGQRKSLKLLKNNQNITWEQFGKKTNLSASQRKQKIKSIKSSITEECKGI